MGKSNYFGVNFTVLIIFKSVRLLCDRGDESGGLHFFGYISLVRGGGLTKDILGEA